MIRKSPNLRNNIDTQIQKVQQTPNRKTKTHYNQTVESQRIVKVSKEKQFNMSKDPQ